MRYTRIPFRMIVLFLTGCSGLVQETTQETIKPSIEVSRRAEGAPTVNISAGEDGWTLSTQQSYRVSIDQEVIQEQRARRFVFWPPAVLPGLIHCPISSLLYAVSMGHAGEKGMRFGCRRLIMQEPLAGTGEAPSHIKHHVSTETITKPLQSGRLEVGQAKREIPPFQFPSRIMDEQLWDTTPCRLKTGRNHSEPESLMGKRFYGQGPGQHRNHRLGTTQ